MNPLGAITLGAILAASGQNPHVSMRAYTGDLQNQQFIMLEGTLQQTSKNASSASWKSTLKTSDGRSVKITFDAKSSKSNDREKWSHSISAWVPCPFRSPCGASPPPRTPRSLRRATNPKPHDHHLPLPQVLGYAPRRNWQRRTTPVSFLLSLP